ncbi:MAG: SIR2 family protein [Planctomycetaceae bacterium]|nr:SIR2 family protein [Planctomycetaceae bacterium]
MEIPPQLKSNIQEGKVVLMLGAGASMEAKNDKGETAPSGKKLGELLAKEFLNLDCKDYPLNQISELAMSESDLVTVQEYIRKVFEPFEPTKQHRLLSKFNWYGLATTNFDRLVEKAYSSDQNPLQIVVPFIDNTDRIDDKLRNQKSIPYLKLHGCITRTASTDAPLILTTDQYVQYRDGRCRVFDMFKCWCYEHIIVFVGYSFQDPNLRQILLEINKEISIARPKYYIVSPDVLKPIENMWAKKNIDVMQGTFNEFMTTIDKEISSPFRALKVQSTLEEFPISERFVKKEIVLSETAKQFLKTDIEYVKAVKVENITDPRSFYKGMDLGWYPIIQNLDVRRKLVDSVLTDHFIDKPGKLSKLQFIVIRAHAGAGKKTLLRRIAWDATHDYGCLCLYMKKFGCVSSAALKEIISLTEERVFLFIEEITDRVRELIGLINNLGEAGNLVTLITTARTNEWNISCSTLSEYVTTEYELKYLSHKDIDNLLSLLEKHKALGILERLNPQKRKDALTEQAGRQLLVALHEATFGKSFVEIIRDEYEKIKPFDAQKIYLSICVLNRLNIPVRAGLISRIYGVSFSDFEKRFFAPLEQIVNTKLNPVIRDYEYTARHPHIAEIIFENILYQAEDKLHEYIKYLQHMNISYQSDRQAFFHLIRANEILSYFSDYSMGKQIYEIAQKIAPNNQELLHQMAIYEMKRPNGSLVTAKQLIDKAYEINPNNYTVIHSIAELKLRIAEQAKTELEFNKCLDDAEAICLQNSRFLDSHGIATLIKSELMRLERKLKSDLSHVSDEELGEIIKNIETHLENGLQNFPGESYLLTLEADLAKLTSDSDRVIKALERSFELNPRKVYIASRLARCYQENNDNGKAIEILKKALDADSSKKELHYSYGKALLTTPDISGEILEYHFKRSYSPGDKNYDAQLLYARQLFINGNYPESKNIFAELKYVRLSFELKNMPRYPLETIYQGEICRIESTYCFIARDGISDRIYCHEDNVDEITWKNMAVGTRVQFKLAFNMHGAVATDISINS